MNTFKIISFILYLLIVTGCTNTTEPELPPTAPSNLDATSIRYTDISLSWNDNSDNEEYYIIERSIEDTTNFSEISTLEENISTFIDTGLTRGTKYYYKVRAVRKDDLFSEYTNIIDCTTLLSTLEIGPFETQVNVNSNFEKIISLIDFEYPIFGISFRIRYDSNIFSINDSTGFSIGDYFGNQTISFAQLDNSLLYVTITMVQGENKKTGSGELCRFEGTGTTIGQSLINIQNDEIEFYDEAGIIVEVPEFRILSSKVIVN